jgi:hypothetical protein
VTLIRRTLLLLAFAGAFLFLLGPAPASAKTPCWRTLINDWYDGRIDGVYPAKCYGEALKHAPEDLRGYSDLQSDLTRALQVAHRIHQGGRTYVPGGGKGHAAGTPARSTSSHGRPSSRSSASPGLGRDKDGGGPATKAIRELGHSDADSLPLPLIALGGLALLLLASGAGGMLAKRLSARRGTGGNGP